MRIDIDDVIKRAKGIPPEDRGIAFRPDYWKKLLQIPPKKETLEMIELGTGYFAWLLRFILPAINCLIFRIFFRIKVEGAKNVPKEGAYIVRLSTKKSTQYVLTNCPLVRVTSPQ